MMQFSPVAIALLVYVANSFGQSYAVGNHNELKTSKNIKQNTITLSYFQFHGVRSLNLIVCPSNNTGTEV